MYIPCHCCDLTNNNNNNNNNNCIVIPTHITENFTILDGHLPAKHQSLRVPQLETEITIVSSTVKTEVEKISTGRSAMRNTLPPSENIIGIEMKTDLPLSDNTGTVETEMKKKVPQFKNVDSNEVRTQWSRNEVKRKLGHFNLISCFTDESSEK